MARCRNCSAKFEPRFSSLEKFCWDPSCKIIEAMQKLEKAKFQEKKEWNIKKAKIKKDLLTVQDWIKITQQAFNSFIRERDKNCNCISCGTPLIGRKFDAGHYMNANNHWAVRFDERNTWGQCVPCNQHQHGNIVYYRQKLVKKFGEEWVCKLEKDAIETRKFTVEELKEITANYKRKIKELK